MYISDKLPCIYEGLAIIPKLCRSVALATQLLSFHYITPCY